MSNYLINWNEWVEDLHSERERAENVDNGRMVPIVF